MFVIVPLVFLLTGFVFVLTFTGVGIGLFRFRQHHRLVDRIVDEALGQLDAPRRPQPPEPALGRCEYCGVTARRGAARCAACGAPLGDGPR